MANTYYLHKDFYKSVQLLDFDERQQIREVIKQFIYDRRNPELKLNRFRSTSKWWTVRTSRNVRLMLVIDEAITIFYRAGPRDEIKRLAKGSEFVFPLNGPPGLVLASSDVTDVDGLAIDADTTPDLLAGSASGKRLFDHWGDQDLRDIGFADNQIQQIRQIADAAGLQVQDLLEATDVTLLRDVLEVTPAERREQPLAGATSREKHYRKSVEGEGARVGFSDALSDDELRALLRGPIEDWQVFLHPDQRDLVKRRYRGASRVSGPAGTGKTVVALHRTAWLSNRGARDSDGETLTSSPRRQSRILFTTFSRSLTKSMKLLYARLPSARPGAVDFINIDSLALKIAGSAHGALNLDPLGAEAALRHSLKRVVTPGSPLSGISHEYMMDEIERLIKGRMLSGKQAYLDAHRAGRVAPFRRDRREQTWELYQAYEAKLEENGIVTFVDVSRMALNVVESEGRYWYRHVIVDEVQDFTLVQLQLAKALVCGNRERSVPEDGLMLVGDDAQRIYSVGYTVSEAGINIAGRRSTRLKQNYRNAREIIGTSIACTGERAVEAIDGEVYRVSSADYISTRTGMSPLLVEARDLEQQGDYIATEANRLHDDETAEWHEMAVLSPFQEVLSVVGSTLSRQDTRSHQLNRNSAPAKGLVTLSTFQRAKGLEFKVVFVVGMSRVGFPTFPFRRDGLTDDEWDEHKEQAKSILHVAMTRARDRLYVLYNGQPSELLEPGLHLFERVRA